MEQLMDNNFTAIRSLVELGSNGHFPLFPNDWLNKLEISSNESVTPKEREKAQQIINRLAKYKGLDRKRTILFSLSQSDRNVFMKVFFQMVEGRILDKKLELH